MAELAAPTAAFKRTIAPGKCTGWISFTLTEDPPPEFEDWCRSHPLVSSVEGPGVHRSRPERQYVLFLLTLENDGQLQQVISSIINTAGAYLDCEFTIDDQGIHDPRQLPPGDDRHLTNLALGWGNRVWARLDNTSIFGVRHWRCWPFGLLQGPRRRADSARHRRWWRNR